MRYRIDEIEGVGPSLYERFGRMGLRTTEDLLAAGSENDERAELARDLGVSESHVLRFLHHADLMRIRGIAGEYAELLNASGVEGLVALRHHEPAHLATRMAEVNVQKRLARRVPSERIVARWVEEAKKLEPSIAA